MDDFYKEIGQLGAMIEQQAQAVNAARGNLIVAEHALQQLQQTMAQKMAQVKNQNKKKRSASNGNRIAEQVD